MTQNDDTRQAEQTPEELREIIPQLQGEPDEDAVLDEQEAQAEVGTEGLSAAGDAGADDEEGEDEYIDADDLLGLLAELKEMLEAQGKEIRGLRREMRELRESQGQGGARPSGDRGGQSGGFRPREDRGGQGGGFRPREDRGGYQGGGDRGGQGGGFRPR
ncbi:hypothetical protein E7T09_14015, partial [Deinococcus sp. KSM4-11]